MGGRRKKKVVTVTQRLDAVETRLDSLSAEIVDASHRIEAVQSLAQREGSWDVRTWARFLDVSGRTVKKMVREGMPHHRIGGSVRFTPEDRQRFLAATEVIPGDEHKTEKKEHRPE